MNLHEYTQFVEGRTSSYSAVSFETRLATAAVGLTGEAAEILSECLNSNSEYINSNNGDLLVKEIGDACWYLAALSNALEIPLEEFIEQEEKCLEHAKELLIRSYDIQMRHALYIAIDLSVAAGNMADQIKKMLFHGKDLDKSKLIDCAKSISKAIMAFCYMLETDLQKVIDINVEKLQNRYKSGKFTVEEFKKKELENGQ